MAACIFNKLQVSFKEIDNETMETMILLLVGSWKKILHEKKLKKVLWYAYVNFTN